jgi:hypothetical protein
LKRLLKGLRHEISIHPTALHRRASRRARTATAATNLAHPSDACVATGTGPATDIAADGDAAGSATALADSIPDTASQLFLRSVYHTDSAATYRD